MIIIIINYLKEIYKINKTVIDFFYKWIIICLWLYLLLTNKIREERLLIFLTIILILILYRRILTFLELNLVIIISKINISYVKKHLKIFNIIINILLILNIFKNPLLFIIYNMELLSYKICKWCNYKFFDYYWLRNNIIILVNNIILFPIKFILEYIYIMLKRWKSYTITDLLLKRIEGIVLSILIFTDIINEIKYIIQEHYFIYIYIFIIIISNIVKYLNLGNFTFTINKINELRADYTIYGYLIKFLLKYIYINKLNITFNLFIYIYFLDKDFINIKNKVIKEINNEKINILSKKDEIFEEIKNKPTNFIHTELILLFKEGSLNILKWKGLYLNIDKFEGRSLLLIKTLYKMDILKIKISLFLIWSLDNYYECTPKVELIESYQDYSAYINYNAVVFRKNKNKNSKENFYFLPFFDYDNNQLLWNSILLLYYDDRFDNIIEEGLYLWNWNLLNLNNDKKLTEERIQWFNMYIDELKVEWLNLKDNNNIKKIIELLLLEYMALEIDLVNLNNSKKDELSFKLIKNAKESLEQLKKIFK